MGRRGVWQVPSGLSPAFSLLLSGQTLSLSFYTCGNTILGRWCWCSSLSHCCPLSNPPIPKWLPPELGWGGGEVGERLHGTH